MLERDVSGVASLAPTRGPLWLVGDRLRRAARRKPLAAASAVLLATMLAVGVIAPWSSPFDPNRPVAPRLQPPSTTHWLGTDDLGRDIASRVMWGARTSMVTGLSVSLAVTLAGLVLGGISGYLGGRLDLVVQRVVDAIQALPPLGIAMVLVTLIGPLTWEQIPITVIIALTVVLTPYAARIARSASLGVAVMPYVEAARSLGGNHAHIFLRHVVPNIIAPMLVVATVQLGGVILAEASLSFLGIGTPPPTPSWGAMLSGSGRTFMQQAPWLALAPGVAIFLAVLAFNFLGDGVRDLTDPRLRAR
jgi:peptide/nickel transport system permease protein